MSGHTGSGGVRVARWIARQTLCGVSLVSNRLSIGAMVTQNAQLLQRVAQIAAIWTISDAGYYFLLPALRVQPNYNSGPVAVTLYYAFWVGIVVITFWPLYAASPTGWFIPISCIDSITRYRPCCRI